MQKVAKSVPEIPCRVFREPIRSGAKKCIHCGTFQNPLAQLLASGPALSLLVALVAVTTPWVPVVKELFASKGTVLTTAFGGVSGSSLSVAVTNVGTMPGSVQIINFAVGNDQAVTVYPLQIQSASMLVEPGKTIVVRGTLLGGGAAPPFPDVANKCAVETWFTDVSSRLQAHRDWFECILAIPAIREAKSFKSP